MYTEVEKSFSQMYVAGNGIITFRALADDSGEFWRSSPRTFDWTEFSNYYLQRFPSGYLQTPDDAKSIYFMNTTGAVRHHLPNRNQ